MHRTGNIVLAAASISLVLPHHHVLELLAQPDALVSIAFVLDEDLVELSELDVALNLLNFDVSFVELAGLLADGALVAIDQLLGLGVLLASQGAGVGSVKRLLRLAGMENSLDVSLNRVSHLLKSGLVHVLEEFVFLDKLVFEDHELGVYFPVLVL